ncbi:MAG TPA: phosphonate ABC transporter, permease protein PhnE, partial [Albitalea sp.]|nr:phosphonate ABC transporter, permease protein PhnE [Albitalea sp.]
MNRGKALGVIAGALALVVASFWSLDLQWGKFLSPGAVASMGHFVAEFVPPETSSAFLVKTWNAWLETLAMSALGTLLAAVAG